MRPRMNPEARIKLNHQISEEAAEWLVEFRSGDIDAEGRRAFDAWVRASPEHLRAFIEMAALWREAGSVDAERAVSIDDLMARAATESNIVIVGGREPASDTPSINEAHGLPPSLGRAPVRSRRIRRFAAAAALVLALVGTALFFKTAFHKEPVYTTDVGEQRTMRLTDGSTVTLNSRSRLRVVFTETERGVDLLEGQALFQVAKNAAKPFVVHSDGTAIRALGTQFDVNRDQSRTIVTVVEGSVAVSDVIGETRRAAVQRNDSDRPILLSAGEQLNVIEGAGLAQPVHANVSSATAWTQGQLVLESASLEQVADQFNRYSARKLVAADHGATPLRLSGVFATDPDFLIRYLRARSDIVIHETSTEIDIVRNTQQ